MTKLSVNINKIATLRNARGGNVPDLIQAALNIERFGAEGITVHPRPDERHIKFDDVRALKKVISTELNMEGYPSPSFMKLVEEVRPAQVTLVPDPPDVLTSNAGWNTDRHKSLLTDMVSYLKSLNCRVSLFIDADPRMIEYASLTGTHRVELYTESYAKLYPSDPHAAITPYIEAANTASMCNLQLNAGHDLSLDNLAFFARMIPALMEVSIGHALISDALYLGLEETVHRYLKCLQPSVD
ncbi:MAG: pyridoxine 5'-phosphate synthase [Bacteroidota bacterium]